MILGPVSLIDCIVFCAFLAPQLLLQAGLFRTLIVVLNALPFFLLKLPYEFFVERYWKRPTAKPVFVRNSTAFEDVVVRCVRYAFANIHPAIGRVFFSKHVALPFLRWRMLRHGYFTSPVHWREQVVGEGRTRSQGVWIRHKPELTPDFVVYYAHGGGFAMGSCYFYLEFLMVWHHLLLEAGFKNPAIFALDYTLVPDDVYPKQIHETLHGYKHAVEVAQDASKVCVAGDSAGGTLILSLLLKLGAQRQNQKQKGVQPDVRGGLSEPQPPSLGLPGMSVLISPWVTLMSNLHRPSEVDYLDRRSLWKYAHEYAGELLVQQPPASPGSCMDAELWKAASPERGFFITYGEEEVFAPDIESFLKRQRQSGIEVEALEFEGGIHAWPVASLFLSSESDKRLKGLRAIVGQVSRRFGKVKAGSEKMKV